jgi:hypothetical protein
MPLGFWGLMNGVGAGINDAPRHRDPRQRGSLAARGGPCRSCLPRAQRQGRRPCEGRVREGLCLTCSSLGSQPAVRCRHAHVYSPPYSQQVTLQSHSGKRTTTQSVVSPCPARPQYYPPARWPSVNTLTRLGAWGGTLAVGGLYMVQVRASTLRHELHGPEKAGMCSHRGHWKGLSGLVALCSSDGFRTAWCM